MNAATARVSARHEPEVQANSKQHIRCYRAGFVFLASLVCINASAADANPTSRQERTSAAVGSQRLPGPATPLQATISYTKIEVVLDKPLAYAKGGLVTLGLKYAPSPVASVQVPGALSYAIGPFAGGFEHTIANADVRALLKKDEAQILSRCKSTLDHNQVDVIDSVHDTTIPLTVNRPDGTVIASASVAYQLGLTCKRPLIAKIGYAKIEYDINRALEQASGGAVPFSLSYDGIRNVSSVQVPGSLSYPLGTRQGSFEHTISNADIRAVLKRDEAAILDRCKSTLEYNKVNVIDTVHDSRIPVTVNAPDGTVVASTTVPYQLGLTCRR